MQEQKETPVKKVSGPRYAVATFVRPDGKRIYVYTRRTESVDDAIRRVKRHNRASEVEHQLISNQG